MTETPAFAALFSDLDQLAGFGGKGAAGIDRTAFSAAFAEAQAWLSARMMEAGLTVRIDAAGNVIGRFGPAGLAVICASHIDTVPGGGRLDGALGVLAGLEAFRTLKARGHRFERALEVIAFADEEGEYFSLFGSRAMLGMVMPEEIALAQGGKGKSLVMALREAGLDPVAVAQARRPKSDFHSYIELHIEQGPVLERLGKNIGVVANVVGIEVTEFSFTGRPDHSGTTPRDARRDALRAGVEFCTACYDLADASDPALRLNFGSLSTHPKALNVVPARVVLQQELRHPDPSVLTSVAAATRRLAEDFARKQGVKVNWQQVSRDEPAQMDKNMQALLRACAKDRKIDSHSLASGAGHDAQLFATVCPTGMLFVQSTGGRSHCPEESSPPEAIRQAVAILTDALGRLTSQPFESLPAACISPGTWSMQNIGGGLLEKVTVLAGRGAAVPVRSGDEVTVVNVSGTQVVDFWCLPTSSPQEYLSLEHCREVLGKIYFAPGDVLVSDLYVPIFDYMADTTGGLHDTLIAPCNPEMYRKFGRSIDHPSCAGNFRAAVKSAGLAIPFVPSPWNLFMRAKVKEDGAIEYARPPYIPDGRVTLRMRRDATIIVSACPDDCYPTNGGDGEPRDFVIEVRR